MKIILWSLMISIGAISAAEASPKADATQRVLLPQTAPYVKTAVDLGEANPTDTLQIRLWLKLRDSDALSDLAEQVTDETSPAYQKWLSTAGFTARFAPPAEDIADVRNYLLERGLKVVSVNPGNLWVSAEGTVATIEKAFGVRLHNFSLDGQVFRANTSDPELFGSVGSKIAMVGGLNNHPAKNLFVRSARTSRPVRKISGVDPGAYTNQCFHGLESHTFQSADGSTTATYTGSRFATDPVSADSASYSACGYDPATIQTAYGLRGLYDRGLDGSGQTVVIVDAFGSPTIQSDLVAYDQLFNLPAGDLAIYQPGGNPVTGPWNPDQIYWAQGVAIDVESVHLTAPGAEIALVETLTDSNDDLIAGVSYAVEKQLGNVIAASWFVDFESRVDSATLALYETVLKRAVVQGISVQFPSGVYGDGDLYGVGYADVLYPNSSRFATSVGGTSLAVNPDGSMWFQTGWGNNEMQLTNGPTAPLDPPTFGSSLGGGPTNTSFQCGSGGGSSRIYPKPHFQRQLSGEKRMVPDISYLSDPLTGLQILAANFDPDGNPEPGNLSITVYGGTQNATMFSALWAIANQQAGYSLGFAAPKLYRLPKGAITDILPISDSLASANVTGSITDVSGTNEESMLQLGTPDMSASFLSTLFLSPVYGQVGASPNWYVLTFGTDSSLATAPGWDPVTGLGTPNGEAFVDAVTDL